MTADFEDEFLDGEVAIQCEPRAGGEMAIAVYVGDEAVHSKEWGWNLLGSEHLTNQFVNSVSEPLESGGFEEFDAETIEQFRQELRAWVTEMNEIRREEAEALLPPAAREIIDGTEAVEIHGGEETIWKVRLQFAGRVRELEFTTGEIVNSSPHPLREKIANQFFELVEIEQEDWETIRDHWDDRKEVVQIVRETARDVTADRVLEFLRNGLQPVGDRDKMADPSAVWLDAENSMDYDEADADAAIAWVQGPFLTDCVENAGKSTEQLPEIVRYLGERDEIFGGNIRRTWHGGSNRRHFYPFDPDALGISEDDLGEPVTAHSEVMP